MQKLWLTSFSLLFLCGVRHFAAAKGSDRIQIPIVPYAMHGKIFDKRRDALGSNVLSDTFDASKDLVRTKYLSTTTQYKFVETNQDANELLDIDGSASLQLELGLVQGGASGAGGYLRSIDDRDNFAELLFSTSIQKDTVSLANDNLAIDGKKCKNSVLKGTHIITGIMYGATCIVSVRIKTNSQKKKDEVKAEVKGSIGLGGKNVTVDAEGTLKKLKETLSSMSNVTVYTFCNAELNSFPTTAEEGINLAKDFPKLFDLQIPDGVPIRMELTPINEVTQCGRKSDWKTGNLLNSYFDDTVNMVQDLKTAYKRLWNCMEILVSSNDEKSQEIKSEAKKLRDSMKLVNFNMKKFMDDVDYSQGTSQFDKVKQIYTNNEPNVNTKIYGNKFWRNKVNETCKQLKKLQRQTDYSSILVDKACSAVEDLIGKGTEDITATSKQNLKNSHDGDTSTCFDVTGSDSEPAVWAANLQRFSRNLTAFEIFFKTGDKDDLGDVDIYISNSVGDFGTGPRPAKMHHVGKLATSKLDNKIGLRLDPKAIRGLVTGNSGYIAVVRLESTKRLSICEIKVKGQLCPTAL